MSGTYPIGGSNPIAVVEGPSFIKYYDRSLQIITQINYVDSQMWLLDANTGVALANPNLQLFGYMWRALMTQDPNWQNIVDLGTTNIDYMEGNGVLDHANINQVVVSNILPDNTIDYWWGSTSFAKFGWFAFNKDTPEMPIKFINNDPCYFFEPYGNFSGAKYGMYGATTAYGTSYSMLDVPLNIFHGQIFNSPR